MSQRAVERPRGIEWEVSDPNQSLRGRLHALPKVGLDLERWLTGIRLAEEELTCMRMSTRSQGGPGYARQKSNISAQIPHFWTNAAHLA